MVMSSQSRARVRAVPDVTGSHKRASSVLHTYPYWFYLPAAVVFGVFFIVPTLLAFYFSLTRWTLFDATFSGLDIFPAFLGVAEVSAGLSDTVIYAVIMIGLKVDSSLAVAVLISSSSKSDALIGGIAFFAVL